MYIIWNKIKAKIPSGGAGLQMEAMEIANRRLENNHVTFFTLTQSCGDKAAKEQGPKVFPNAHWQNLIPLSQYPIPFSRSQSPALTESCGDKAAKEPRRKGFHFALKPWAFD
jgi:hypothetical protein